MSLWCFFALTHSLTHSFLFFFSPLTILTRDEWNRKKVSFFTPRCRRLLINFILITLIWITSCVLMIMFSSFSLPAIIELGNKFIVLLSERCETCDFKLFIKVCCFLARSPTKTSSLDNPRFFFTKLFAPNFKHKISRKLSDFQLKVRTGLNSPPAVQRRVGCENFMTVANLLFMTVCHRHHLVDAQTRTASWTGRWRPS